MDTSKLIKQMSYSKIQAFYFCPFKFKMNYYYFYRPKSVNSIYGTFGTAIHFIISKKFTNGYNLQELNSEWESVFLKQIQLDELGDIGEEKKKEFIQLGHQLINNFYGYFKDNNLFRYKKSYSELKFKVIFKEDGYYDCGKIDLILEFDDYYQIIDFKTSKSVDSCEEEQLQHYMLGFYNYLVKNHLPMKKIVFGFFFLRHKKYVSASIKIKQIKKLINHISATREMIKNDNFKPKQNKFCDWCEYKKIYCPLFNKKLKVKTEFKKKLKYYQLADVAYMMNNVEVLNACEMGTGKTVVCLYLGKLLAERKIINGILVVTPNSIKYQWEREIRECIGDDFNDYQVISSDKNRYKQYKNMDSKLWTIVNYELLNKDIDYFKKHWGMIILDEATRIKNCKTDVSKNVKSLVGTYKIALTGTPIENKIEELYSIYKFISRHLLGSWEYFDTKFIKRGFFNDIVGYKNLGELRNRIDKTYLRHTLKEIANDLPPLIQKNRYLEMGSGQVKLYNNVVNDITGIIKDCKNLDEIIDQNTLSKVVYLREICDSANLVDANMVDSIKLEEIKQILKGIDLNNDKVVIFSQFVRMINIIEEYLKKEFKGIKLAKVTGEIKKSKNRQAIINDLDSGKVNVILFSDCAAYGINAQTANYMINVDLPFNPAIIKQRIGRIYRINQKKNTIVINLLIKDSIEDRVMKIIDTKNNLFNSVFNNSGQDSVKVKTSKGITFKELKEMIK